MQAPSEQQQSPILCGHCKLPLDNLTWNVNLKDGLVIFFHNNPECMVAVGFQLIKLVPPEQPRIQIAQPTGLIS